MTRGTRILVGDVQGACSPQPRSAKGGMEEMALEAEGGGGGQASPELLQYLLGFPVSVSGNHKSSVL